MTRGSRRVLGYRSIKAVGFVGEDLSRGSVFPLYPSSLPWTPGELGAGGSEVTRAWGSMGQSASDVETVPRQHQPQPAQHNTGESKDKTGTCTELEDMSFCICFWRRSLK